MIGMCSPIWWLFYIHQTMPHSMRTWALSAVSCILWLRHVARVEVDAERMF